MCWKVITTVFFLEFIQRLKATKRRKKKKKTEKRRGRRRDIKAKIINQRLTFLLYLKFESQHTSYSSEKHKMEGIPDAVHGQSSGLCHNQGKDVKKVKVK